MRICGSTPARSARSLSQSELKTLYLAQKASAKAGGAGVQGVGVSARQDDEAIAMLWRGSRGGGGGAGERMDGGAPMQPLHGAREAMVPTAEDALREYRLRVLARSASPQVE